MFLLVIDRGKQCRAQLGVSVLANKAGLKKITKITIENRFFDCFSPERETTLSDEKREKIHI